MVKVAMIEKVKDAVSATEGATEFTHGGQSRKNIFLSWDLKDKLGFTKGREAGKVFQAGETACDFDPGLWFLDIYPVIIPTLTF